MPWTLYRYILRELLKLLVVTVVVLVTVISFAAAIKPLSEGLLGPAALLKFVGYSSPTMLGFALPFAGAFASTLVFIRMAGDNEILACRASGMSYRTVLLPVVLLGVVLTMGLFYLSNFVIPYFYRAASQTVESDLMTVLVRQLNQDRPFDRLEGVVLTAESAQELPPPELPEAPLQPSKLIVLDRVALGQLDDEQGRLRSDATAARANVLLFRDVNESWITIRLREVMYFDPQRGQLAYTELYDVPPVRLPNPFRDSPKFFSWPQLRELDVRPDLFPDVREAKLTLAQAIGEMRLRDRIRQALATGPHPRELVLDGVRAEDSYVISSPVLNMKDGAITLLATEQRLVTVAYRSPDLRRRLEAQSAVMTLETGDASLEPSVHVRLYAVRVYDPQLPGEFTERDEISLPRMTWPEPLMPPAARTMTAWQMLEEAQDVARFAPVRKAQRNLYDRLQDLGEQIKAQLHERAASAVSCLLLLLLGAVLSMRLAGQLPLVVYFWSFLLAILTIILIHTGENIAGSSYPLFAGLGLLWSGNVMLAVVTAWVYCALARN